MVLLLYFGASMQARPNDGVAYVIGWGGYGGNSIQVVTSNSPGQNLDINDSGDTIGSAARNNLDFAQNGTGYFVWRHHPAGYQSYLRQMNSNGTFTLHGVDLGGFISTGDRLETT